MSTTSTHETEITADPNVPLVRIVRQFDAPPSKVFRATYEGFPDGVALERLVLEDLGGRTPLTATSLVDSFEGRDAFLASGMESGVREGYERLDALLAR